MAGAAAGARTAFSSSAAWDAIVIGARVFGSWTAWTLQRAGHKVLLLDAWGAAHNRASSGGETRLIRTEYAGNALYTRWAWASLAEWQALSKRHESPIFHSTGAHYLYPQDGAGIANISEEHTSGVQSLMRISYDVFCLNKTNRLEINQ